MRRRPAPPPSAQQMIREYLGRVSVAATKVLPKGDRLLFVGRTRAAIEARVGPLASADADDVLSALNSLGEPEALAKQERERLYSARRRGAAAAPTALWKPSKESRRGVVPPPPARRPAPPQGRRTRAWPHRGLTGPDEPQPAESAPPSPPAEPLPAVPRQAGPAGATSPPAETPPTDEIMSVETAAGETAGGEITDAEIVAAPGLPVPDLAGLETDAPEPVLPEPVLPEPVLPESAGLPPGGPEAGRREQNGTPPGGPRPPRLAIESDETTPTSIVPGMTQSGAAEESPPATRRSPAAEPLAEAWALARKHRLEAVAAVLLGVGGLIFPFPFWLIGGLIALRSRLWDARDKWIALAGPPLVTFAVLVIRAATSQGNFFSAFYHASRHDVGLSIRAGCVLCAAYLIWRLRRGPRLRTIPPWQRPR